MKRTLQCAALFLLMLFSLSACGPSSAEEERRAAAAERDKLHEERKEMKEEQEHKTRVERDCAVSYNTCVARCEELLYPSSRTSCINDCASLRVRCLDTK